MTADEPVGWRKTRRPGSMEPPEHYHTDRDCCAFPDNTAPVSEDEAEELDECPHCAGDVEQPGSADYSYINALKEASQS